MPILTEVVPGSKKSAYPKLLPRWLKVSGAAAYANMSRSQLYNLMADGQIKYASVRGRGNGIRFARLVDRLSLDAFLEGCSK
jgi:hypothetical protein